MTNIDDFVDSEWQPSSDEPVVRSPVEIHTSAGRERKTTNVIVEVRVLENGLLYAVGVDDEGVPVLELEEGRYVIGNYPKGRSPYQLINLVRRAKEDMLSLFATFEYKAGRTPDGQDAARIEYTTWHDDPTYGLTVLTSLQAYQAVEGGWLDLQLGLPTLDSPDRTMTVKISSLGEELEFDSQGVLKDPGSRLFWASKKMKEIYDTVSRGVKIDALQTAKAVVNGFPSQRPLQMETLVKYMG